LAFLNTLRQQAGSHEQAARRDTVGASLLAKAILQASHLLRLAWQPASEPESRALKSRLVAGFSRTVLVYFW
jgi:hypothetical protein